MVINKTYPDEHGKNTITPNKSVREQRVFGNTCKADP